ncbi:MULTISPECIES: tyrosine-type recombinase/integrase [unclassified Streptomyces]|uniref:tyrosine-type recombinase/integrase n=1 Tax=unclassified Streptomyces TaxID=2593676 RepID=UPI00364C4B5F
MTTPRPASSPRTRSRANGDGTVYQRKDSRWEAAGYVLAPGNTRKRVRVYGTTRKEALAKLTEKIAASNRGLPVPSAQGSMAAYLTYWLENVAVHHLRENTNTRYTTCVTRYLIPGLSKKRLAKLTRTFTRLLRPTGLRRIRFHDLRHSTATLLLEQGVELVVIKKLLGHAHIGVTATVYAHVRLRLQRQALDTLGVALDRP